LRAKRPELARGRREQKYSPKAKFPLQFSFFGTRMNNPSSRIARDWVRILRPQIDKLACQAKGVGIFAEGEIPVGSAKHTENRAFSLLF
jgi:hypothetical protein